MPLTVYAIYLTVFSLFAFLAYVLDKVWAKAGAWRIPETVLLTLSFLGGAFGGYLAMNLVRHKTRKWQFHLVNLAGLSWQIALLIFLIGNPNIIF